MLAVQIQSLNIKILEFPSAAISESWQANHMSAQLLSDSKSRHALGCWGRREGGCFLFWFGFYLPVMTCRRACFSKTLTGKIAGGPKQVLAWKKPSFTRVFYRRFFNQTYELNIRGSCCLIKQESADSWTQSREAVLIQWPTRLKLPSVQSAGGRPCRLLIWVWWQSWWKTLKGTCKAFGEEGVSCALLSSSCLGQLRRRTDELQREPSPVSPLGVLTSGFLWGEAWKNRHVCGVRLAPKWNSVAGVNGNLPVK